MTIEAQVKTRIKVADEVWIGAALLHRENPDHPDFLIGEIQERVQEEGLVAPVRPGVYVHIDQHCVANRPPNPGRYRMLFETGRGRRRLFRKGDPYHPEREAGKIIPKAEEIPEKYHELLTWYREWSSGAAGAAPTTDPLLFLAGSGKKLWADEHADEYVSRLREGWE